MLIDWLIDCLLDEFKVFFSVLYRDLRVLWRQTPITVVGSNGDVIHLNRLQWVKVVALLRTDEGAGSVIRFDSRQLRFRAATLGKSHTRASVTKQYNLVTAQRRWCSAARKETVGMLSYRPFVAVIRDTPHTGSRPLMGGEHLVCSSKDFELLLLFTDRFRMSRIESQPFPAWSELSETEDYRQM